LPAGNHEATDAILARVEAEAAALTQLEPMLEARLKAVQATQRLHAGDQTGAIALLDAALALAGATGDVAMMCELRVSLASVWADLGQLETAEALLRHALREAQTIELHYITTAALITLGPVLTDSGRLGEARRLTMQALNFARKQGDLRWEGAGQLYLSTISFVAGEHLGSEQRARRAAEIVSAPLLPSALAAIARALLAQAHPVEALEQAGAAAAQLATTRHVEKYESLVHLMLAEALDANGDVDGARAALRAAAKRLRARAAQIENPEWRHAFLTRLPDNARTLALARLWGVGGRARRLGVVYVSASTRTRT